MSDESDRPPTVLARCRECGASLADHDWDACYMFVPAVPDPKITPMPRPDRSAKDVPRV